MILAAMAEVGASTGSKYSRYAWVLDGVLDEIVMESDNVSAENLASMFAKFGKIIAWVGDGDPSQLPEEAYSVMVDKYPHLFPKAIEAAS